MKALGTTRYKKRVDRKKQLIAERKTTCELNTQRAQEVLCSKKRKVELARTTGLTAKKSQQSKILKFFKAPKTSAISANKLGTRSKQIQDNSNMKTHRKAVSGTSVPLPPVHSNRKRSPSPPN